MQRVRVGLTCLATVFLLVTIAAAGIKPARQTSPATGQGETLAVLGVAPSSGAAAAPQRVPPRAEAAPR